MKILAIETSCDDTGIAILSASGGPAGGWEVLANIVAGQIELGKKYGGVYPLMAKREHEKNLPPTLETALSQACLRRQAKVSLKDIDLIAVTNGPGLEPCLWVGVNFAKDLAKKWNIPLVPVNHIEGHILVNFLDKKEIAFPAVALVVSGGHTQIILMRGIGKYKILGETRDDAAGECFDKCAKILGLGYPGGPIIAKLASQSVIPGLTRNPGSVHKTLDSRLRGNDKLGRHRMSPQLQLPRPMINSKDYDFSFSGLKTAVLYAWQKNKQQKKQRFFATWQKTANLKAVFATEIQQAIIDVLIKKTMKAVKDFKAKTLILGGGVSANEELRKQFKKVLEINGNVKSNRYGFLPRGKKPYAINFLVPPANLSTDNGLMIAVAGYFNRNKKMVKSDLAKLQADANLRIS